jgi:hypothetical protein
MKCTGCGGPLRWLTAGGFYTCDTDGCGGNLAVKVQRPFKPKRRSKTDIFLDWWPVIMNLIVIVAFVVCLVRFIAAHEHDDTNDLIWYGVGMLLLAHYRGLEKS